MSKRIGQSFFPVALQIEAPMACWTNPLSGSLYDTFPVPTRSAMKAIMEKFVPNKDVWLKPYKCHVCRPVRTQSYVTNGFTPYRIASQFANDMPYTYRSSVLTDVCYQFFALVLAAEKGSQWRDKCRANQQIFYRRLRNGSPCAPIWMGRSEFVPSRVGPIDEATMPNKSVTMRIPAILDWTFDTPRNGKFGPVWRQNLQVIKGVIQYAN